jgi:hypothetical protein
MSRRFALAGSIVSLGEVSVNRLDRSRPRSVGSSRSRLHALWSLAAADAGKRRRMALRFCRALVSSLLPHVDGTADREQAGPMQDFDEVTSRHRHRGQLKHDGAGADRRKTERSSTSASTPAAAGV